MESDTKRGEDSNQRDVDAGGAERRVTSKRGGGEDVEGEEERFREEGETGSEEILRFMIIVIRVAF